MVSLSSQIFPIKKDAAEAAPVSIKLQFVTQFYPFKRMDSRRKGLFFQVLQLSNQSVVYLALRTLGIVFLILLMISFINAKIKRRYRSTARLNYATPMIFLGLNLIFWSTFTKDVANSVTLPFPDGLGSFPLLIL